LGGWHWLFLINVPFGIVAFALGSVGLPSERGKRPPFDTLSAVLIGLAAASLVIAVDLAGRMPPYSLGLVVLLALVASGALLVRQRNHDLPMLPIDLLRLPAFAGSVAAAILAFTAQTLAFIALPFFFQTGLAMTTSRAGLLLTAWPIATAPVSVFAGWLTSRFRPSTLGGIGMAVFVVAASTLGLAIGNSEPNVATVALLLFGCGLGFGLFQAPNNKAMLSSVPRGRAAAASGMQAMSRLLGQALGAAIAAIFLANNGAAVNTAAVFVAALAGACAGAAAVLPARLLKTDRPS